MNIEVLNQIIAQQAATRELKQETVKREITSEILKYMNDDRVLIITGVRRCGKSTILKQLMHETNNYCYVNFDDERFIDFKAQEFEQLNEALIKYYGNPRVYFFDEVQNIEKFETFVRRLQDQSKKVIITGSNASLLSKEFGTRLTGRHKIFEAYPFNFKEYLKYKGISYSNEMLYITEKKVELIKQFNNYMTEGGMPEYIKNKDMEYIHTIYENILYKDVIARYDVRREKIIKEIMNTLASNPGTLYTYNALLKTTGLKNAITVKEYINYLTNAYLLIELSKFDYSIRKQLNAPKKTYLIDPAFNQTVTPNKGHILENIILLELKRKGLKTYYHAGRHECDFITLNMNKPSSAIQVCQELNNENKKRELDGLKEAMKTYNTKGIIITSEQEDEIDNIKIIPAWKWLLQD